MPIPELASPSQVGGPTDAYYVMRTLRMLEVLAFGPTTATHLADILGVHPRTTRRMLQQFVAEDWAVHNERTHRYTLNPHLAAVAIQSVAYSSLVARAVAVLSSLAQDLAKPAHLFIPSYRDVASVARVDPDGAVAVHIGDLRPHHLSAAGHALLAHRESWRELLYTWKIDPEIGWTVSWREELSARLDRVRQTGFAAMNEPAGEMIAAPVWENDEAIAAICAHAEDADSRDAAARAVVEAAQSVSRSRSVDPSAVRQEVLG